jgi:hypothetical protein
VEKNMGMISNFTSVQPVYWNNLLTIIFGRQLMSFLCREMESHFQPTTSYGGVLGTAMSCQPGVVGDPEKRTDPGLRRHQLSSERRIPSVVPRPGAVSSPCTATMSRPAGKRHFEPGEVRNAQRVSLNSPGREPASLGALVDEETLGTDGARYVICITALRSPHTNGSISAIAGPPYTHCCRPMSINRLCNGYCDQWWRKNDPLLFHSSGGRVVDGVVLQLFS